MRPDAELVLIDLSSIAYPIWHMSQSDPDPNKTSHDVVARVLALSNGHKHVAVCCDSGRSFRCDIAPDYKGNREEKDERLQHQIAVVKDRLAAEGFPCWSAPGMEADDIIASATAMALRTPHLRVLIVSADKDLLQLVSDRVAFKKSNDGTLMDAAAVGAKFGVSPDQILDYLTLVGDASDNVAGAKGVGPKTAAELLGRWRTLDAVYAELDSHGGAGLGVKPSIVACLQAFRPTLPTTRALLTLKTDVEIPFATIAAERVPRAVEDFAADLENEGDDDDIDAAPSSAPTPAAAPVAPPPTPSAPIASVPNLPAAPVPSRAATPPLRPEPTSAAGQATEAMAVLRPDVVLPAPSQYERQLDPRSMPEAMRLAKDMYDSRMFSAYGTPQAVLSTIMVGREMGIPAMASLRGIHVVEGRHGLSAHLMVGLILKSGLAEYFTPIEFDEKHAIFETLRKGALKPIRLEHTIEMARTAGLVKPDSNWVKVPIDMLAARAQSRLARLVYPDLMAGLYTPEELEELKKAAA